MDKAIKNKAGLEVVISLSLGHKKIQVKNSKIKVQKNSFIRYIYLTKFHDAM